MASIPQTGVVHGAHLPASSNSQARSLRPAESAASSTRSASSSQPNGPSPTPALTVDAVLEAHATHPSPTYAGLETTISERNLLSSQNAQLWKLIEKQRSGYSSVLKDLERIRAERDAYKQTLSSMGVDTEVIRKGKGDHRLKASASGTPVSGLNGVSAVPARVGMVRNQSEDRSSASHAPSRDESPARRSPLIRHQSEEDARPKRSTEQATRPSQDSHALRSNSVPGHARNESAGTSRPQSPPVANAGNDSLLGKISPPPLLIPGRTDTNTIPFVSLTSAAADSESTTSLGNLTQSQQKTNGQTFTPASSTSGPSPLSQFPLPPGNAASFNATNDASPASYHNATKPFETAPPSSTLTATGNLAPAPPIASRESRVPLPDEARLYITNMVDSPRPSPSAQRETFSPDAQGNPRSAATIQPPTGSMRADDDGQFLELDDSESGATSAIEESESVTSHVSASGPQALVTAIDASSNPATTVRNVPRRKSSLRRDLRTYDSPVSELPSSSQVTTSADSTTTEHAPTATHITATQQGLHPSSAQGAPSSQLPLQRDVVENSPVVVDDVPSIQGTSPGASTTDVNDSLYSESLTAAPSYAIESGVSIVSEAPERKKPHGQPSFRELPLLASDLPNTTITVVNSTIKPNDRGKEVLSLVIAVEPGSGKPGWRIEKMYSDVLGLDHRIRLTVGKTVTKKIATLPEGKMWKDHAPARADQRKIALEAYLISLISLPIKSKDEIISFLTTDIIREAQRPVYQAGYKEGYLTKRGKNFGGWKSRYFVLNGPVLEYYESRGGTHLGSIQITGAQIGRQQKTDRAASDDDNEYRHAFLIIEAKKGPGGSTPRHVLCAQTDSERDGWVDVLVRYVSGVYNDEGMIASSSQEAPAPVKTAPAVRKGSLDDPTTSPVARRAVRGMSKDNIVTGSAVPISQLAPDANNAKLMHVSPYPDSLTAPSGHSTSPITRPTPETYDPASQLLESSNVISPSDPPLSTSLPTSSPLEDAAQGKRSNSELGHYSDMLGGTRSTDTRQARKSYHPTLGPVQGSPTTEGRPRSPENVPTPVAIKSDARHKISAPFKGAAISNGFKFGSKDSSPAEASSSNDRREKAKSRSFWGFGGGRMMPGAGGNDKAPVPAIASSPVFGVALEHSLEIAEIAGLPAIVFRCIQYLEAKKADQEEGIYRLSGSSAVIKSLKDRFNMEGDVDLLSSDEFWDPHAIAGLLKSFLRELPTSILTRELHLQFLAVIDFVDPQERIRELSDLIARLPVANYSLLRALTAHLIRIVQNANVNKMTMRNVGIVFSPTLGIPAGVFSLMLGEFTQVFNVNGDADGGEGATEDPAVDAVDPERHSGIDRRNSQRYTDAAADRLLGLSGRTLATPVESDEGDDVSVQYDSTDEAGDTVDSQTAETPRAPHTLSPSDANRSKAQSTAASRGLSLSTSPSADLRARRQSRMPGVPVVGLPSSPRPGYNPPSSQDSSSPPASPSRS